MLVTLFGAKFQFSGKLYCVSNFCKKNLKKTFIQQQGFFFCFSEARTIVKEVLVHLPYTGY